MKCKYRTISLALFLVTTSSWAADQVSPPNSLVVADNGNVGIGVENPTDVLHVQRDDNTAKVRVAETAASTKQVLFELAHAGFPQFNFLDTGAGNTWSFRLSSRGGSAFEITKTGTGGAELFVDQAGNLEIRGTLTESSSRAVKEGFLPVDAESVLFKLKDMKIGTWQYTSDTTESRHIGPVAEDFYEMYGLGADNKHIAPKDLAGVALVSAQALYLENQDLQFQVNELKVQLAKESRSRIELAKSVESLGLLEERVNQLMRTIEVMSSRSGMGGSEQFAMIQE